MKNKNINYNISLSKEEIENCRTILEFVSCLPESKPITEQYLKNMEINNKFNTSSEEDVCR